MNPPAETHFTISPEEWMNLSKVALWHDYGDPGLLHNIIDEYADALISQRVAVVRPTRDQLVEFLRDEWLSAGFASPEEVIDALISGRFVAVSDSQETPEP